MGNAISSDEINSRLHAAVEKGDLKEIQKYHKKGGDFNKLLETDHIEKPLNTKLSSEADRTESTTTFDRFVDNLASDIDDKSSRVSLGSDARRTLRMNALHRAASRKNNMKILRFVVDQVDDVDKQDSEGDTALHYVSMFHNNDESVVILLRLKPNINLQNALGQTSLFSAISHGCDLKIIEWLLKTGADPNIATNDGNTSLHACAMRRGIDPLVPGLLLRFGANPNLKNKVGQTPLHMAAEATNNAVLLLLKFNAKVRLRDNNGNRPSQLATSEEIRKVLLEEENDVMERTTRTSDIIQSTEATVFATAPPASAQTVQSWLNGQNSIDSISDFERAGSIRSEKGRQSQILYPRRSRTSRTSVDSYYSKFTGGGGDGVIELPNNKEIVIPPDAMPLGTHLKVTISSNDTSVPFPDLSGLDFKLDIKIDLPGKSQMLPWGSRDETVTPPAFTGMCLEGNTSWQCLREVVDEDGSDSQLKFSLKKETSEPLTKRKSGIQIHVQVPEDIATQPADDKQSSDESNSGNDSGTGSEVKVDIPVEKEPAEPLLNERFWARQVLVVKEASDTSGSCDGSEADSFAEEDFPNHDGNSYLSYGNCVDEPENNSRIQHPIDQELATITEEDSNLQDQESQRNHNDHSSAQSSPREFGGNVITDGRTSL